MLGSFNLEKSYHLLLIALAFLLPLTVFGGNLVIVLICIIWFISGDYKAKFNTIISSKLMIASILFFTFHLIGLVWTENLSWGLHIVHKMWYFIALLPILFTIMRKENIGAYISAFLLAISLTEICSYLIWFEFIEPFKNATVRNPTPFMSHISYNPILAFAIYLVLHEIFFNKELKNLVFFSYSFFAISMTVNMFLTGGRAGHVVFFVMISILIFQILDKQRVKSLIIILLIIPGIFFAAYVTSDLFQERVDLAVKETIFYTDDQSSSVGKRINYATNSWHVIKKNILIGIGTGDFPSEYAKSNQLFSPKMSSTSNPHNMYILVSMQLGLFGLLSLLSIFYYQIKLSFISSKKFIRDVGLMLPLMFLVMMLSDSYLLGHYTTLMFVFFSSFLYKDFEKN